MIKKENEIVIAQLPKGFLWTEEFSRHLFLAYQNNGSVPLTEAETVALYKDIDTSNPSKKVLGPSTRTSNRRLKVR